MQLPPSPNWYAPGCISVHSSGRVAYAANSRIVIVDLVKESWPSVTIITKAHSERISCVLWVESGKGDLVSGGDDGKVKLWNSKTKQLVAEHEEHGHNKIVAISSFKLAPKYVVSGDARAQIYFWNTENTVAKRSLNIGKLPALSVLACSPYDEFTLALGFQQGTFMLVDVRGRGQVLWKVIKGHDDMLTNISWCPGSDGVFGDSPSVATSSKSKVVVWDLKEKRDVIFFRPPLRYKGKMGPNLAWITAHWLDANTILTSGHQAELLLWDLRLLKEKANAEPRNVHRFHSREIFNITSWVSPADGSVTVWTSSQDRRLIQFRVDSSRVASDDPILQNTSVDIPLGDCLLDLQTLGGFLNCVKTCPTDGSVVAIAVGDGQMRAVNTATPAVMTGVPVWLKWKPIFVAWHPETEGLLAFGAEDGKVGMINTLKKSSVMLFSKSLKGNVYKIQWVKWRLEEGPEKYYLWACGGKTIGIFDSDDLNAGLLCRVTNLVDQDSSEPSIKVTDATDFAWNHNFTLLAVGSDVGLVSIFKRADTRLKQIGYLMASRKLVNTLEWLPEQKGKSGEDIWLAVGSDESTVKLFCISKLVQAHETSAGPVTVQPHSVLEGHKDKVCAVAWNPHQRGILATASGDTTVRVWNAFTGELLAVFTDPHGGRFFTVEWSEWEDDLIYCGGDKNCMYSFKPSEYRPSREAYGERKVEKKEFAPSGGKKMKSFFPLVATAENRGKERLYEDCLALVDLKFSGKDCEELSVDFYMEGEKFQRCVEKELSHHLQAENPAFFLMLHVWTNRPWEEAAEKLQEAGLMDDFLFAVQKSDTAKWKAAAEYYAQDLIKRGDMRKAATFFHLLGRPDDVVEVLLSHNLAREAFAYAKLNFPSGDERIKTVTKVYAAKLSDSTLLELAAKLYISVGSIDSAIQVIMRRGDSLASLLASELAKHSPSQLMSKVYAMQCVYDALTRKEHSVATRAVALNESFSWCEPVIEVHSELSQMAAQSAGKVRVKTNHADDDKANAIEVNTDSQEGKYVNGGVATEKRLEVNAEYVKEENGTDKLSSDGQISSLLLRLKGGFADKFSQDQTSSTVVEIRKNFCAGQIPAQSKQMLVHLSGRLAVCLLSTESPEELTKEVDDAMAEYATAANIPVDMILETFS